jgi:Peptidase family S41
MQRTLRVPPRVAGARRTNPRYVQVGLVPTTLLSLTWKLNGCGLARKKPSIGQRVGGCRLDVNRERSPNSYNNQFPPGPQICLINHYSLSDGGIFPYFFRRYGRGKLLGTRRCAGYDRRSEAEPCA